MIVALLLALTSENLPSVYWVPVKPELQEYSVFTDKSVEIKASPDRIKIEYDLPEELTGATNHIEFHAPRSPEARPLILTGEHGRMECPSGEDFRNCRVFYTDLNVDPVLRAEIIKVRSATEAERQKREAVASSFCIFSGGGEPCGFLTVYRTTP